MIKVKTLKKENKVVTLSKIDTKYKFSSIELCYLYILNPEFRKICDEMKYIYMDGYICINSRKYIDITTNSLTKEAKNNLKDCCLSRITPNLPRHKRGMSRRYSRYSHSLGVYSIAHTSFVQASKADTTKLLSVAAYQEFCDRISGKDGFLLPMSFAQLLKYYMKDRNTTQEKLAEEINVSTKTISRLVNDEHRPKLKTIVAICVALTLYPHESNKLIASAGYKWNLYSQEDKAYHYIISCLYKCSLDECNQLLERLNLKKL